MRKTAGSLEFTATDLVGFLNCRYLSYLDLAVAEGARSEPDVWDPMLKLLWERGSAHEAEYVAHLTQAGSDVVRIDPADPAGGEAQTLAAMKAGASIIVQGSFSYGGWIGRPDVLRRVEVPSALGSWSYEAIDTKLARETKAGTILQLCLYSDLLRIAQGVAARVYVRRPALDGLPAAAVSLRRLRGLFPQGKACLAPRLFRPGQPNRLSRADGALRYLPLAESHATSAAETMTTSASLPGSPRFRSTN